MQQTQHNKKSFNDHKEARGSLTSKVDQKRKVDRECCSHKDEEAALPRRKTQGWPEALLTGRQRSDTTMEEDARLTRNVTHRKTKNQMQRGRGRNGPGKWREEETNVTYGRNLRFYIVRVKDIYTFSPHLLGAPTKILGAVSNTLLILWLPNLCCDWAQPILMYIVALDY